MGELPNPWQRTPWWKFWRPKWRRIDWTWESPLTQPIPGWEYASDRELAQIYLREEFSDT